MVVSIDDLKHLSLNGSDSPKTNGTHVQELDALIVGAGFGGVWQLKRLRDEGYKVKLVECGDNYGGVWYWNRYPGARVDSAIPFYEFSDPALWKDWTWKERFPGSAELRSYFSYVADKWDLRKDTQFETFVSSATWDDVESRWTIKTKAGETYKVKYFLLNTGFAAKRYIPDWEGIDKFKGTFLHPSYWPHEEPDLKGKRVAVIGTGSTGIQIAQELSKVADHLTVFQRTCNMSLPMRQVEYVPPEQYFPKPEYPALFEGRTDSFSGFAFNFLPRSTFDDEPEERAKTYEKLWAEGDFSFWLATYYDMLFTKEANNEAYKFWRDKTRAKINDPKVAEILAPTEQPYAFGCKRISLEQGYFEIYNQPNVSLVDTSSKGTPIVEITEKGIKTSEKEHEFDFIVCATGYDAVTGGLCQIDIKGPSGVSLKEHWSESGAKTYLGLGSSGFPNMFFTYGPQGPTALCNGPTCAQLQGDWIVNAMNYMKEKNLKKIVPTKESEAEYKELIWKLANASLLPTVDSWYMGTNIPGKTREPMIYLGGVPTYYKTINESAANGYTGFELS
ncbi:cyclopentanone 1,2-monooxygenase [Aaosphaeria arxii CBS 175.79]|uniref:Cyclopentanone 1,2-monooxygenase n=1 Tax=Aaosphaeria arxii CBS 175.79 TaxID=1450172 RepID=A0A6A5Y1H1_9PLEO|nr:cyclopentanone 1,2-monooxygenase [Aaosphaeria arxii CBS 175.79]KAF2019096.1 cyclopentanone 1,2-monooxygenase [Aaosphaeria arxii CBS 175.79]